MTAEPVEVADFVIHGADPADIVAAVEVASADTVTRWLASLVPEWHADALCREFDLATWFPSRGETSAQALDICGRCPVRPECLDEALADPSLDFGVRGGASATARKVMRRTRRVEPT